VAAQPTTKKYFFIKQSIYLIGEGSVVCEVRSGPAFTLIKQIFSIPIWSTTNLNKYFLTNYKWSLKSFSI